MRLSGQVTAVRFVDHAGMVFLHLLRRWATEEIDERALSTEFLRAFDICLLAVTDTDARRRLLEHGRVTQADHARLG